MESDTSSQLPVPTTSTAGRRVWKFIIIGGLVLASCGASFYGGTKYGKGFNTPRSSLSVAETKTFLETPVIRPAYTGFCDGEVSLPIKVFFLASPLSFICGGKSNLLADLQFSWELSPTSSSQTLLVDIRPLASTTDSIGVNELPRVIAGGRTVAGSLTKWPGYIGLGPGSYLDALKSALGQQGYASFPFEIVLPESEIVIRPILGEKSFQETWSFVKVENSLVYVIEATYIQPPDGSLKLDIFVADPVEIAQFKVVK